jgi:hypothetical protein
VENEVGGKKVEQNAGRILPYNVWCILTVKGRLDVTLLFSSLLQPSLLPKSTPMSSVGYWEVISVPGIRSEPEILPANSPSRRRQPNSPRVN